MTGRLRWLSAGLRDLALAACFLGALSLEAPGPERLAALAVLFVLLFGWVHLRDLPRIAGHRLVYLTYAVDLALVFLIEQQSRFIINYYFHAFYTGPDRHRRPFPAASARSVGYGRGFPGVHGQICGAGGRHGDARKPVAGRVQCADHRFDHGRDHLRPPPAG